MTHIPDQVKQVDKKGDVRTRKEDNDLVVQLLECISLLNNTIRILRGERP